MSDKLDKIVNQISDLSVTEVAELVKSLEEKFGVSAAVSPTAASTAGADSADHAAGAEQAAFDVILVNAGAQKIAVIKALREINPNLGLKEAKDLSETANAQVLTGAAKAAAEEAKAKLTAAGASVELK